MISSATYLCNMLIEIGDKVVSAEIFKKKFVCDLSACKGACCVEGDSGAPLTEEEVSILEDVYDKVKPYMRQEGIDAVEETGVFYMDYDNEPVTTLVNKKECAFVNFDADGTAKCSIDQAYRAGDIDWRKPISCYLYPIRAKKYRTFEALNYHEWPICKPACDCGSKLDVSIFKFLKDPLITAYGEAFYKELEVVDQELKSIEDGE